MPEDFGLSCTLSPLIAFFKILPIDTNPGMHAAFRLSTRQRYLSKKIRSILWFGVIVTYNSEDSAW